MESSSFTCCIFHVINTPFICNDTAIWVAKRMYGAKVITFCFPPVFALFLEFCAWTRPQDLWPFLISEAGLKYEPKVKFVPVTGQPDQMAWARAKRPLDNVSHAMTAKNSAKKRLHVHKFCQFYCLIKPFFLLFRPCRRCFPSSLVKLPRKTSLNIYATISFKSVSIWWKTREENDVNRYPIKGPITTKMSDY